MNQLSTHTPKPGPAYKSSDGTTPREHINEALRVALVTSSWHADIVDAGARAVHAEFEQQGYASAQVERFRVPGAFEIPLLAQRLARSGHFSAVIACGLVVNGGIYRHEFVAAAVIDGLMRVQLDHDVPVFSAVLTPRDFHDHDEHHAFFAAHLVKKGAEVAQACMQSLNTLAAVRRRLAAGHAAAL